MPAKLGWRGNAGKAGTERPKPAKAAIRKLESRLRRSVAKAGLASSPHEDGEGGGILEKRSVRICPRVSTANSSIN
ncbi:hypothetical protein SAMN05880570_3652 [Paenibacillus sp. RU4T]|nr:hypothetical protein SAMN05880555_3651 [Paenibacillus sp. RU4X]SIR50222.1 hypothetical protein SAMN05880570_3652 [Paenibacillus sp. RU4T]